MHSESLTSILEPSLRRFDALTGFCHSLTSKHESRFRHICVPAGRLNGGLATFYFELSRALVLLGHEVLVVTLSQHESRSEIIDGVRVERIHFDERSTTNLANLAVLPSLSWFVPRMLQLQRKAAPLIDEFSPDVIECAEHGFLWLLDASNRKRPLVVRCLCPAVHAISVNADAKTTVVDLNLLLAMEASLVRAADALTTPSANLAAVVAEYTGVPASEFRIIKNPLASVGEIQRDAAVEKTTTANVRAQESDFPRMTFIGRVENLKGCDLLIEMLPMVLAKYPNARLTMIGQDAPIIGETYTLSDKLRERLKQLGCLERVRFTGAIPRHQIRHYLDETDFCIFPSVMTVRLSHVLRQCPMEFRSSLLKLVAFRNTSKMVSVECLSPVRVLLHWLKLPSHWQMMKTCACALVEAGANRLYETWTRRKLQAKLSSFMTRQSNVMPQVKITCVAVLVQTRF